MKTVILQVVQHLQPGGIETMALELQAHPVNDETTYVVSLEGSREEALERWPRLQEVADQLIFLDKKPGWRLDTMKALAALMREHEVNVVHTHHIGPLIYGGMAARMAGVKSIIHTEHDAWHLKCTKRRWLQNLILKLVRPTLVADADTVARALKQYLPGSAPNVVYNGIDTDRFCRGDQAAARAAFGLPQEPKIVGCAARMEEVKGHQFLVEAMAQLGPEVHLALAGSGSLRDSLKALAESLGVADRIYFLGNQDDMPRFYQSLDLFCLPSLNEGLPLAPLEAQACGVRAVVTNAGGAAEALCPETGILVPPGDATALADAIRISLASDDGVNPRSFIEASRNLKTMARGYALLRPALG